MHIQKIFVILAFNNQLMETLISLLVQIPGVGGILESPVRSILGAIYLFSFSCLIVFSAAKQKEKLHGGGGGNDSNILRWGFIEKYFYYFDGCFIESIKLYSIIHTVQ